MNCSLAKCNRCGNLLRNNENLEWVQRTDAQKKRALNPRNPVYALGISGILLLILFRLGLFNCFAHVSSGFLIMMIILTPFAALFAITLKMLNQLSVNSASFIDRYVESIKRTREPIYGSMIGKSGTIYGEDLPEGMSFSEESKAKIEEALKETYKSPFEFIPLLTESVFNS